MSTKFTYGEITTKGIYKLNEWYFCGNKKVLDIGSGYGRIVRLLAEDNPEMECVGIELDANKHNISNEINKWSPAFKRITYIHGDIFNNLHLLSEADYIIGNIIAWDNEDIFNLVKIISSLPNKLFIFNSHQCFTYETITLNVSWNSKPQPFYKLTTITHG